MAAAAPPGDDALSVFAAARQAPDAVALRLGECAIRFRELAQRVEQRLHELAPTLQPDRAFALPGHNSLDALLTLYALLEQRVPALLLNPRLTAAEQQREIEATTACTGALPAGAAAVLYTSGTTGRARGAVLTRSALLASAHASAQNLGWQDDDCWLLAMPVARVGGLSIVTRCLAARRAVALAPGFDAATLPQALLQQRVTQLSLVPTMLSLLLDAHPQWTPPPALRLLLLGGSAAPPRLLARAAERRLPVVITYGCTETCSQVVATPYARRFETAAWGAGRPLHGAELRFEQGRILVRGPMRMASYLGEPPLDPLAWFDTGDLGELDAQGCLRVHARRTDLIVSGGENVYPAEVEQALEACPGVRAAAVFGVPDETWGQIVAAALVADVEPPDAATLQSHLEQQLARHKRPRLWCWVERLPITAAGKPDRAALQALQPQWQSLARHGTPRGNRTAG